MGMGAWLGLSRPFTALDLPPTRDLPHKFGRTAPMAQSHVFAGVGGYYGGNQGNLAGVFRRDTEGSEWKHVLTEPEAYTVFVHPRDPGLVLAGTKDGIYRSTDSGATFKCANFPDNGVQIWSFLPDPADPKRILAGGSPVSIYRSNDDGASWTRQADPKL